MGHDIIKILHFFSTVFSCEVQWPSRVIDAPADISLRLYHLNSILLKASVWLCRKCGFK